MLSATADTLFDKESAIADIQGLFADVRGRSLSSVSLFNHAPIDNPPQGLEVRGR